MKASKFGAFRLEDTEASLVVHPLIGSSQGECFDLPPMPLSRLIWLTTLVRQFYTQQGRCMTVILTLDLLRRRWARPIVPTQRCWAAGCSWSLRAEDFTGLEEGVVAAGTLSSTPAVSLSEFMATVPSLHGVHFVRGVAEADDFLLGFVMLGDEAQVIEAKRLLEDDWATTLDLAAARMRLE